MPEPFIQIGSHVLSDGQAMAVRVAISNFHMEVSDPEFAADLGPISAAYRERLSEVLKAIIDEQ